MISEGKNWVSKTEASGQATTNQMYRRKIIRMEISIALKKQEKEKEGSESPTI